MDRGRRRPQLNAQSLSDQRWVVTGGTRGIGAAVADLAHAAGARVAVLARGADPVNVAERYGDRGLAVRADLTDLDSLRVGVDQVVAAWGGVDVLVNNAGVHRGGRVGRLDRADWDLVLETNLSGPFEAIRAVLPAMADGSAIVNVGALVGFRGFPGDSAYASAKAGLSGLTLALAMELASRAIRVNLVVPGFTETEMTDGLTEKARTSIVERIPLGRPAAATEIGEVVLSVAAATYMTGSLVSVDGGLGAALGSAR